MIKRVFGLFGIFLLVLFCFCLPFIYCEITINEVELNPVGGDSGNEWIELYSPDFINITNFVISSSNGRNMSFNASFSGYYILITSYNLLTNINNALYLIDNNSALLFSTINFSDSSDDIRTWQYCDGNWTFRDSSKGYENNCTQSNPSNSTNSTNNSTIPPNSTNQTNLTNPPEDEGTYLELVWDEEDIKNGQSFEIEVSAYNLEDINYDLKIWIEDDNANILSDRFDEPLSIWKSGFYYVNNFFSGGGNEDRKINLRIKENYKSFSGDANLLVKLRKSSSQVMVFEITKEINVYSISSSNNHGSSSSSNNGDDELYSSSLSSSLDNNTNNYYSGLSLNSPIVLTSRTIGTEDSVINLSSIVYKSKNEYIKQYMPYAFGLCILLIMLLLAGRFKINRMKREEIIEYE